MCEIWFVILGGLGCWTLYQQQQCIGSLSRMLQQLRKDYSMMYAEVLALKLEVARDQRALENLRATSLRVSQN